jgi:hypothetical protein
MTNTTFFTLPAAMHASSPDERELERIEREHKNARYFIIRMPGGSKSLPGLDPEWLSLVSQDPQP